MNRLFFWIYRPHNLLCKYYTVCLFDDHGVDNIKNVTITQWKSNPRVLIVHGAGCYENEDSYVSIVAVPRLGCKECKQLRDEYCSDGFDGEQMQTKCTQFEIEMNFFSIIFSQSMCDSLYKVQSHNTHEILSERKRPKLQSVRQFAMHRSNFDLGKWTDSHGEHRFGHEKG